MEKKGVLHKKEGADISWLFPSRMVGFPKVRYVTPSCAVSTGSVGFASAVQRWHKLVFYGRWQDMSLQKTKTGYTRTLGKISQFCLEKGMRDLRAESRRYLGGGCDRNGSHLQK